MILRGSIALVLVALGCSAAGDIPSAGEAPTTGSSADAGKSINLPDQELCGNDADDDDDGLVDEGCDCESVAGSGEVPSVGGCKQPDSGTTSGCVPDSTTEVVCDDGR